MATVEPPPYTYNINYATVSTCAYRQTTRFTYYSQVYYAITEPEVKEEVEQEPTKDWRALRRHFIGFNSKVRLKHTKKFTLRQPSKCHRNIRRERIQRMNKKFV